MNLPSVKNRVDYGYSEQAPSEILNKGVGCFCHSGPAYRSLGADRLDSESQPTLVQGDRDSWRTNAFTLIELMIVISIITIVSGVSIPAFSRYIRKQNLKQAYEQIKSDFRTVQNKALTGALSDQKVGSPPLDMEFWGISFTEDSPTYTYFISATDSSCDTIETQGTSKFSNDIVSKMNACVFFSVSNGGITGPSPVTLGYLGKDENRTLNFNEVGLIY